MFKRYLHLVASLFVIAFGVALITKADLGTSPNASIPYVLSLFTAPTMGQFMMGLNLTIILAECLIMGWAEVRRRKIELALQIPIGLLFGLFIDLSFPLIGWFNPDTYLLSMVALVVGCCFLAVGIAMEVQAGVAMMPPDYITRLIASKTRREFGTVKVCFDTGLVGTAVVCSLLFSGGVAGVREGTVIAAIIVGPMVRFSRRMIAPLDRFFTEPAAETAAETTTTGGFPHVITITREYCSGGRELGEALSKILGIPFYDKELIRIAAEKSHLSEHFVEDNEQSLTKRNLFELIFADYNVPIEQSLSSSDRLFVTQSRIIRELARRGPCIILGRCADYVLSDRPHESVTSIFCYTEMEDAERRCREEYKLHGENPREEILRMNEARAHHYHHYTGRRWGDPHNYSLMVNIAAVGTEQAARTIASLYQGRLGEA